MIDLGNNLWHLDMYSEAYNDTYLGMLESGYIARLVGDLLDQEPFRLPVYLPISYAPEHAIFQEVELRELAQRPWSAYSIPILEISS